MVVYTVGFEARIASPPPHVPPSDLEASLSLERVAGILSLQCRTIHPSTLSYLGNIEGILLVRQKSTDIRTDFNKTHLFIQN